MFNLAYSEISLCSCIALSSSQGSAYLLCQLVSCSTHGADALRTSYAAGLLDGLFLELD